MRSVCLTLPTNRECAATVSAIGAEADHAARHFGVQVHLLILDSADPRARAAHAEVLAAERRAPGVQVHHLDETAQRAFLRRVIERSGAVEPELLLDLMLPSGVSYGACTNRAFLYAAALGCDSVHRRDSDSRYQVRDGRPVFPVHQELAALGRRARDAAGDVSRTVLDASRAERRVVLAGGSFVGELSVDIGGIQRLDPDVYHDVVSLWAPLDWPEELKRDLVAESFRGAGNEPFTGDLTTLGPVDPMRVDMCNISLHREVYERVPLPPATDTIGSDYFLLHLVHDAGLPGLLHNRHIVNYYTPERRTDSGFTAYQTRLTKFFLSMLYLNAVYDRMAEAGAALLDGAQQVRPAEVARLVRDSTRLDRAENERRLDLLTGCYRRLGGRYGRFTELLAERRGRLLDEAQRDMEDFALLIEDWDALTRASRGAA
ncbi:DUF6271 family protein [Streptomyces sp. MS06]|uniref:DUF6271 family protein n=1 Tax=Streptomyces sp. MS06 TaxID=3385974 RepID=UPI0039A07AA9